MAGAVIVRSTGISDIALHRNLIAGMGVQVLRTNEKLTSVLWLDDDMVFSVEDIAALKYFASIGHCAVTAVYCKRGNQKELTCGPAFAVNEPGADRKWLALPDGSEVECVPVIAGMGAMLLSREDFLRSCELSQRCFGKKKTASDAMPAVCFSGPMANDDGSYEWVSEDRAYSSLLWSVLPGGLFAVPVAVGHISEVALLPDADAAWL